MEGRGPAGEACGAGGMARCWAPGLLSTLCVPGWGLKATGTDEKVQPKPALSNGCQPLSCLTLCDPMD